MPLSPTPRKAHAGRGQMKDGVVHAAAPERKPLRHPTDGASALCKKIQGKGAWVFSPQSVPPHQASEKAETEGRGPKISSRITGASGEMSRRMVGAIWSVFRFPVPPMTVFSPARRPIYPVIMLFIHHSGIIRMLQRMFSPEAAHPFHKERQKRFQNLFLHQTVIGRHAGLSAV